MNVTTRLETPADIAAIHEVNPLAFGQASEARLVDLLRDGDYVRLSLVAECEGKVAGHILFSDLLIRTSAGQSIAALALAPMAVLPQRQRRGVGAALVREGLVRCAAEGHRIVVVLGHPEYYPRFGFSAELARNLHCPYPAPPEAWMALELVDGALKGARGTVEYPPPFAAVA